MNRILNINLGGHAVTIDDDAYEYLKAYLENIRKRFTESDGRDEIMRDVEDRLGELVNQYKGNNTIVMLPHVESAIEIMGKPEDFGGEPTDASESGSSSTSSSSNSGNSSGSTTTGNTIFGHQVKTGKRLFRDENDAVVSGVCSGLSAYFGITDPVWMRLIFVLLALISAGFWIPVYILLLIIVPPARSTSERLEMKGEPINVDSIAREFEKGYERLSERVSSNGGKKFIRGTASASGGCLYLLGRLGVGFLILIAASMVLGLGAAWVTSIFAFFSTEPYLEYFSPLSTGWTYFGVICIFLVLGLPIVSLCLWLARTIFRVQPPTWLKSTLGISWGLSFLSLLGVGSMVGSSMRTSASINKSVDLSAMQSDTLKVRWNDMEFSDQEPNVRWEWPWNDGNVYINNEHVVLREFIQIRVRKSTSGSFECRQEISARGSSDQEAAERAATSAFTASLSGNELRLPNRIQYDKNSKWWVRHITIYIGVPEGKSIVFDDNVYRSAAAEYDDYAPGIDKNYISRSPGMVYRMTKDGLTCATCPSLGDANYRSDNNYEKFIFEGNFDVEIRQGDNFTMRIEGEHGTLETIPSGEKITITSNGKPVAAGTKVIISTNVLTSVYADNTGMITIRGFEEGTASLSAKGSSRIKAFLDASQHLDVALSGQSRLELNGRGGDLRATLSDDAEMDASGWRAHEVEASATGRSKGRVYAEDRAIIKTTESADLRVEGTSEIERK